MIMLMSLGLLFVGGLVWLSVVNDRKTLGDIGFMVIMGIALAGFITMEISKSVKSQIVSEKISVTVLDDDKAIFHDNSKDMDINTTKFESIVFTGDKLFVQKTSRVYPKNIWLLDMTMSNYVLIIPEVATKLPKGE